MITHSLRRASANISSIQLVGSKIVTATSSASNLVTMSLTDLTGGLDAAPLDGDMVIVMAALADGIDYAMSIGTGYTLVGSELKGNGPGANLRVARKVMSGSPDTSVTIDFGVPGTACIAAARVYRSFDAASPLDVSATTAVGAGAVGSSEATNPPAISPVTRGSIVLAVGAGGASGSYTDFTSSDLSNFLSASHASANTTLLGFGDVVWGGGGAVDPAAFGGGWSVGGWAALTMAIRST